MPRRRSRIQFRLVPARLHPRRTPAPHGEHAADVAPRPRVPITTALMVSFGLLVFLAVAGVLVIGLGIARQNTLDLMSDKAVLAVDRMVGEVRNHLDPVLRANVYLAGMIARGDVDPGDTARLAEQMIAAMAATPQVSGMGWFAADGTLVRVGRGDDANGIRVGDWMHVPAAVAMMRETEGAERPLWGPPFWSDEAGTTFVNLRSAVRRDGRITGVLASVVAVDALSRFIAGESPPPTGMDRFVLYGRNQVLAHRSIGLGVALHKPGQALPGLEAVDDPVVAALWEPQAREPLPLRLPPGTGGHGVVVNDRHYVALYRELGGYGAVPLVVGGYIDRSAQEASAEIRRLTGAAAVAVAILIVSVLAALWLGRRMGEPLEHVARAARHVRHLDLERVPRLRRSRLRELDEAAAAFNAMVAGLRWFENYVPRTLVRRLLAEPGTTEIVSSERPVTVMFTDIVNFTGIAEHMSAGEAAALLNEHFALLGGCVDAEEGTIDKYIGDSLMAFWGPPLAEAAHAARACRAALAIRAAVGADNERRRAAGLLPIRVRIGIHTGLAIVGNIGAPGRVNYTLVGDTVNVAQRLQEIGKLLGSVAADVDILLSGDTAAALGDRYRYRTYGPRPIRGRDEEIEVLRLVDAPSVPLPSWEGGGGAGAYLEGDAARVGDAPSPEPPATRKGD
jgi:class 3 adenylate cyclase